MGISKRELLEDYYPGEFGAVLNWHNKLHDPDGEPENLSPMDFLGDGGEHIGFE